MGIHPQSVGYVIDKPSLAFSQLGECQYIQCLPVGIKRFLHDLPLARPLIFQICRSRYQLPFISEIFLPLRYGFMGKVPEKPLPSLPVRIIREREPAAVSYKYGLQVHLLQPGGDKVTLLISRCDGLHREKCSHDKDNRLEFHSIIV